jgi:hypothetical protein
MDLIDFLKHLPPDLTSFLAFIATPTVLGPILSELLEYLPAFQKLVPATKTLVLYVLMVLIGLLSYALVRWVPASALENAQPIYSIMIGAAIFFASSQLFHNKVHGTATEKILTTEIKTPMATVKTETSSGGALAGTLSSDPPKQPETQSFAA